MGRCAPFGGIKMAATATHLTAQEPLTKQRQAGVIRPTSALSTTRPPGQIGRESVVARHRHRVGRQQITCGGAGGP